MLEAFLKAAQAGQKAGIPFGIGPGMVFDPLLTAGAIFCLFGSLPADEKEDPRQNRSRARGSRVLRQAGKVLSAGCAGLGRCLQQQVAGVWEGRPDHEPAERLGGRLK